MRQFLALCAILGLFRLTTNAEKTAFTPNEKAFYADANAVNFIRPGFVLKITSASVDEDGTIKARVKLTDPKGLPLDRDGITTPGTITVSFIVAVLPADKEQFTAYTTRVATSPITGVTATQAGTDTGGTFAKIAEGEYEYTFARKAPSGFDANATHQIGAYGTRDLREFELDRNFADAVYAFVPSGSAVERVRDVVRTASCNNCHNPLALHGGARRSVELCVMCHTPQSTDPDTGNTVNFPVMVHKIHMGKDLPSVKAGKPYKIIGNAQSEHDFSTVAFPAEARNCEACHNQKSGAAQATAYLLNPSRAACGACHDNVNFATGENHVNLPQVSDHMCKTCHWSYEGEVERDISIIGAHRNPRFSLNLPGTVFDNIKVVDGSAGKSPTVLFTLKDKKGNPIPVMDMARLAIVLAGPTVDYAAFVSEDARAKASCGGDGTCAYTFATVLDKAAKGTFSVGIEGYRSVTLLPGTRKEVTVRDAGVNKVAYFSVDGSATLPRRQVVATEKCNNCHNSLSLHGDNRNRVEQCVTCHAPNLTDAAFRKPEDGPANGIQFARMIHQIHTGEENQHAFTVVGRNGAKFDFTEVRFPGDRRDCATCHVNGSENLPLKPGLLNVSDPRGLLNPMGPVTSACTGCHTSIAAASHALGNTTDRLGESCVVCHGPNADFSVAKVHAR